MRFREPFERLSNIDEAKVIQVVMVRSLVGEGDGVGSPMRQIVEFFSTDGELLARRDSYKDGPLEAGIWSSDAPGPEGEKNYQAKVEASRKLAPNPHPQSIEGNKP